jgi:hypothetical protein
VSVSLFPVDHEASCGTPQPHTCLPGIQAHGACRCYRIRVSSGAIFLFGLQRLAAATVGSIPSGPILVQVPALRMRATARHCVRRVASKAYSVLVIVLQYLRIFSCLVCSSAYLLTWSSYVVLYVGHLLRHLSLATCTMHAPDFGAHSHTQQDVCRRTVLGYHRRYFIFPITH